MNRAILLIRSVSPLRGPGGILIELPVEEGGPLPVQVSDARFSGDPKLTEARPGGVVVRARQTLERVLDQNAVLRPHPRVSGRQ